jgi:transcription antitermination factor NusG
MMLAMSVEVQLLSRTKGQTPPILYPADRSIDSISSGDGRWWVAHTKSKFEKAFAWDLINKKIGYFLPLVPRIYVRGGVKRRLLLPLFPSYVFFFGDRNDRTDALCTDRLCQVIYAADQSTLVSELSHLKIALESSGTVNRCKIPRGQLCRVTGGPMLGTRGVVVGNQKSTRLILQVSILGQGVSMEIDGDLLEPVDQV